LFGNVLANSESGYLDALTADQDSEATGKKGRSALARFVNDRYFDDDALPIVLKRRVNHPKFAISACCIRINRRNCRRHLASPRGRRAGYSA
jgi:hypothetical protein